MAKPEKTCSRYCAGGLMISVGGCYYPYRYWRDHDYYHRDGRYDGRYYGDRGYYHRDYDRDRW